MTTTPPPAPRTGPSTTSGRPAGHQGQRALGEVFDANALDPSTRRRAARGGYDQGQTLAEPLAEFWRDACWLK